MDLKKPESLDASAVLQKRAHGLAPVFLQCWEEVTSGSFQHLSGSDHLLSTVCGPITWWVSAWRCFLTGEASSLEVKRFWTLSLWYSTANIALLRARSTQNKLGCIWITDGEQKGSWSFSREVTRSSHCTMQPVCRGIYVSGVEGGKNKACKSTGRQMFSKGASHFVAENQNFWVLLLEVLFFEVW